MCFPGGSRQWTCRLGVGQSVGVLASPTLQAVAAVQEPHPPVASWRSVAAVDGCLPGLKCSVAVADSLGAGKPL